VQQGPCVQTDYIDILVQPEMIAALQVLNDTICLGSSTQLFAFGGIGSATYSWSPPTGLSATDGRTVIASPTETTTYTLRVSEAGCFVDTVFTIAVLPVPDPDFVYTQPNGCRGLTVSFQDRSLGASGWAWEFGDGGVSNEPNPTHTYRNPGDFTVTLTTGAEGGCLEAKSVSAAVRIAPPAGAAFESNPPGEDTLRLPESVVQFLDRSEAASRWYWQFGDSTYSSEQNPVHVFRKPGDYLVRLIVEDKHGCPDTAETRLYRVREPQLLIPNVFTPNGDGTNDVWQPLYLGNQPVSAAVFDRWGNLVFEQRQNFVSWNGKYSNGNSDAADGQYFYILEVGDRKYKGNVLILR
jgi:gliding motility-associated-like protein